MENLTEIPRELFRDSGPVFTGRVGKVIFYFERSSTSSRTASPKKLIDRETCLIFLDREKAVSVSADVPGPELTENIQTFKAETPSTYLLNSRRSLWSFVKGNERRNITSYVRYFD